jgi:hypothetical protein
MTTGTMPQTSESNGGQGFGRNRWPVTGKRTPGPVREQKSDSVRTGQSGNQDGSNNCGHVGQYGSPGFPVFPTRSDGHTSENHEDCSKGLE